MTSIAKLKDKARKHEQKEDWQAAIEVYQRVLDQQEEEEDLDLDLGLFNRIGDLNLRLGQTDEAVSYYETAADKYAESGFYNNAIALCNKALRHRPDRPAIYLKLSRLCTEQGFQTDARRWILEYAEREVAAGEVEAALTGLEEFADLSDDPEVREMLAQQLATHDRQAEALEQLRLAYGMRVQAGEMEAAEDVAEKARAIDPGVELEADVPPPASESAVDELPGLDEGPVEAEPAAEVEAEELAVEPTVAEAPEPEPEPEEPTGLEGLETRTETVEEADVAGLEGLESTAATDVEDETAAEEVSGLEVSYAEQAPPASPEDVEGEGLGDLETFDTGPEESEPEETAAEPLAAEAAESPEGESGTDFEDEEEAEPLPLIDSGYEEEAGEEEAEPLPMMDTGYEDMPEDAPAAADEAPQPGDEVGDEAGGLDLSFDGGDQAPAAETEAPAEATAPAEAGASEGPADDAMDLDFGSFDLGFESSEETAPDVEVEDLDTDAVLDRARELVSRGLTSEALRELHLLSGSEASAETFRNALAVVNEIVRHDENDISALQRRVEYGARIGDREVMVDAYLDLAEALERLGAETKSRVMYERALDLDPSNETARTALGVGDVVEEEETIDLDAILREMEPEEVEAASQAQASDPNFAAMLNQFKAKVTENVEPDDAGDHYDLGLAFKEMGLIDEAIAEFQTALTGGEERLKVYEELGQCFVLKGQYNVALKVFDRALKVPHTDDDELLGVYYHMGQCYEELGQRQDAKEAYGKVLAIDESFADVPDRMARL
jgi:tetratricopeptide (TPR) repeat protein